MAKSKLVEVNKKIEEKVVGTYKKLKKAQLMVLTKLQMDLWISF